MKISKYIVFNVISICRPIYSMDFMKQQNVLIIKLMLIYNTNIVFIILTLIKCYNN